MLNLLYLKYWLLSKSRREPYFVFKEILGFFPRNIEYYQLAMLHRSANHKNSEGELVNNERLEFLGDAIINIVVTDVLYQRFDNQSEGILSNARSRIVNRISLNKIALAMGLDKMMHVSKNLHKDGVATQLYGNALEALVAAVYLDYGFEMSKIFVRNRLLKYVDNFDSILQNDTNYKSRIIEYCQKYKLNFEFKLRDNEFLNSNVQIFYTELFVNNDLVSVGSGSTKKMSEQSAAYQALHTIENRAVSDLGN